MKKTLLSLLTAGVLLNTAAGITTAGAAELTQKDEIKVAMMPNYPPLEFKDPATGELTGMDYDLGMEIGKRLNRKINWQEIGFEQMVNAVATKRIDMILSGMTDTKARQPIATFVDYYHSGPQFYTTVAHSEINQMLDLCGKKVGTSRRTTFPAEIAAWSQANCEAAGKPAIVVVGAEGTADARTQLRQGRIDGVVQGSETLPYIMNLEKNTYKPLGKAFAYQVTGMGIAKDDSALIDGVKSALTAMIADGTYMKILTKWGMQDGAVTEVTINGGK
ncbi:ABC transporter substrate-binding protein [Sodalis sp. C49]|uniref:ABC transporter substrate-binding protein n=1 Tax=unclassified Sodalis (in: enterobacteria) TaxID=2636512 RepID=UPI003965BE8B